MAQLALNLTDEQMVRIASAVGARDGLGRDATADEILLRVATYLQYIVQEQETKSAVATAQAQVTDLGLAAAATAQLQASTK